MKNKLLFGLPLIALTLCGCDFFGTHIVYPTTSFNPTPLEPLSPYQPNEGDGYKMYAAFEYNLQDVKAVSGQIPLSSDEGDSYMLVVPVKFSNAPYWTDSKLDTIRKGFFGEESDTAWESVSSYYKKSSYDKVTIKGEVAPVLNINVSVSQASTVLDKFGDPSPDSVAIEYFENDSTYDSYRKDYDKDGDGFIDSIVFVYSNNIDSKKGYWAWCYWGGESADEKKPVVNSYLWMSYWFFKDSSYSGYGSSIDSHTAIHEVGHLMGLDDYYRYDEGDTFEKDYDASGSLEMHAYNIGDENIYSKFALGWVYPYYVKTDSSVTLTLRTSAQYGDAILINDTWNKTSMDEYLMIEYYSPYGLNERDAVSPYGGNGGSSPNQMFTTSGFRIYHIDSRICATGPRGQFDHYVDDFPFPSNIKIAASNTPSRSCYDSGSYRARQFKYVHLLESGGINTFRSGKIATNDTLFKTGSTFVASSQFFYYGDKFNDGHSVGYRISVGDCQETVGTITIEKI